MKFRTWHGESAVVASVLIAVVLATGGAWIELLGAGAVLLSFMHASVADRLAEREAARGPSGVTVDCHRWNTRYLVGKESLWLIYFIAHGSWSALAGVGMFLVYPLWRKYWRSHFPLRDAQTRLVSPVTTGEIDVDVRWAAEHERVAMLRAELDEIGRAK